jgi:hypothetical protein
MGHPAQRQRAHHRGGSKGSLVSDVGQCDLWPFLPAVPSREADLVFIEMFKTGEYQEISLAEWMAHSLTSSWVRVWEWE